MDSSQTRLRSAYAVRRQSALVFALALEGESAFNLRMERLGGLADKVTALTQDRYPDGKIPFHSRRRNLGKIIASRSQQLADAIEGPTSEDRLRAEADLAVLTALLDAGTGTRWRYREKPGARPAGRSEGMALASMFLFVAGLFSGDKKHPHRADAETLIKLDGKRLYRDLQISEENPLPGFEGRLMLLRNLGEQVAAAPKIFPNGRPGDLAFTLAKRGNRLRAEEVMSAVQEYLGKVQPNRYTAGPEHMGDVYHYAPLGPIENPTSWIPFHAKVLWLTFSLFEILGQLDVQITHTGDLPGIAEYRNGGLFIDGGVLAPKDSSVLGKAFPANDPLMVEWRALTVMLLEKLAEAVRFRLDVHQRDLPLIRLLEAGTWLTGRAMAQKRRAGGPPPILLDSDGTLF